MQNQYQNWLEHKTKNRRHASIFRMAVIHSDPNNTTADYLAGNHLSPSHAYVLTHDVPGNPNWNRGYHFVFYGPREGEHAQDMQHTRDTTENHLRQLYHPSIMGTRTIEPLPTVMVNHADVSRPEDRPFIDLIHSMWVNHLRNPWHFSQSILPNIVGRHLSTISPYVSPSWDYFMEQHANSPEEELPQFREPTLSHYFDRQYRDDWPDNQQIESHPGLQKYRRFWGDTLEQAYRDYLQHTRFVNPNTRFQNYIRSYRFPQHDTLFPIDPLHRLILAQIANIYNPFRRKNASRFS